MVPAAVAHEACAYEVAAFPGGDRAHSLPTEQGAVSRDLILEGPRSQPPHWTRGRVPRSRWTALAGTMPRAVKAPNSVKLPDLDLSMALLMLQWLLLLGWPWPCLVAW